MIVDNFVKLNGRKRKLSLSNNWFEEFMDLLNSTKHFVLYVAGGLTPCLCLLLRDAHLFFKLFATCHQDIIR
jgi:hypothetical protein